MADTPITKQADAKLLLIEAWQRFWSRSPKYFRVWQVINAGFGFLGMLPELLTRLKIILPGNWLVIVGYCVSAAGWWAYVNNRFPVSKPEAVEMPFTEKKQIEQAEKMVNGLPRFQNPPDPPK